MTAAAVGVLAAAGMCGSNVDMQLQGTSMWQMRRTGELTPFQCPWCGRWHGTVCVASRADWRSHVSSDTCTPVSVHVQVIISWLPNVARVLQGRHDLTGAVEESVQGRGAM